MVAAMTVVSGACTSDPAPIEMRDGHHDPLPLSIAVTIAFFDWYRTILQFQCRWLR